MIPSCLDNLAILDSSSSSTAAPIDILRSHLEPDLTNWDEVPSNSFDPCGPRDMIGMPEDDIMMGYDSQNTDRPMLATDALLSSSPILRSFEGSFPLAFNPQISDPQRKSSRDNVPALAKPFGGSYSIQKRSSLNKGRKGMDSQSRTSVAFEKMLYGTSAGRTLDSDPVQSPPSEVKQSSILFQIPSEILTMILEDSLLPPWPESDSRLLEELARPTLDPREREDSPLLEAIMPVQAYTDDLNALIDKSIHPAKTLVRVARTCGQFRKLVMDDPHLDISLWRQAARSYFQLPRDLHEVQGINHITSWHNVFNAFLTFESPSSKNENVPSFGGKCMPALSWEQFLTQKQSFGQKVELNVLCLQPGPDDFEVVYNPEKNCHTVFLGLRGGDILVSINSYGEFGTSQNLSPELQRSKRGWFPADLFEMKSDRFGIQQVVLTSDTTRPIEETRRWDLSCVNDIRNDEISKIARCAQQDDLLVFSLFRSNEDDDITTLALGLDPTESNRIYCVAAEAPASHPHLAKHPPSSFKWTRRFKHHSVSHPPKEASQSSEEDGSEDDTTEEETKAKPHYDISSIQLSTHYAAVLIRWNTSTYGDEEILDADRQFHILDIETGATIRTLHFPPFTWDFRHSDMSEQYNSIRLSKMKRLFNARGANHRTTRVHDDQFIFTELPDGSGRIVSGSHDYCNWIWNFDSKSESKLGPDFVLDDFYWKGERDVVLGNEQKWSSRKERAGWWVHTPNQVLDFWHGFAKTPDGRYFTACRAGKIFFWDLEDPKKIHGYTSLPVSQTPACELPSHEIPSHERTAIAERQIDRYLGRSNSDKLTHQFRNWFEWKSRIPEQGLWMSFKDGRVVYLDRDAILSACGVTKRQWRFSSDDFEPIDGSRVEGEEGQVMGRELYQTDMDVSIDQVVKS